MKRWLALIFIIQLVGCGEHRHIGHKKGAEATACLANQKQLFMQMLDYLDNHKRFDMNEMIKDIESKNKSLFICPICGVKYKINSKAKFWKAPKVGDSDVVTFCPSDVHTSFLAVDFQGYVLRLPSLPTFENGAVNSKGPFQREGESFGASCREASRFDGSGPYGREVCGSKSSRKTRRTLRMAR